MKQETQRHSPFLERAKSSPAGPARYGCVEEAAGLPTCYALRGEHQLVQVHHTKRDLDAIFAVLWSICHGEISMLAVDPRRDTNGR